MDYPVYRICRKDPASRNLLFARVEVGGNPVKFGHGIGHRGKIMGWVGDQVYVATYTDREDAVRFISVRRASKREADRYYGRT